MLLTYNTPSYSYISSIELSDLTGDSVQDVVISYGYDGVGGGIQVIEGNGNLVWDFPTPVRLGDLAVGDINNDGKPDVVVVEYFGNKVYAIDNAGSLLWTTDLEGVYHDTVTLGDVDGDGTIDVAVADSSKVCLIGANGQLIWTFDTGAGVNKAEIGDLDGDGSKEVVAVTEGGWERSLRGGMYAINSDGSLKWFLLANIGTLLPKPGANYRGFRDLVVVDLNNDGRDEIVAISLDEYAYALATPIIVAIDIKPDSFPNNINLKSKGKIAVAILSAPTFDAPYQLDQDSLTFGSTGDEHSLAFCNPKPEDVNHDGRKDVVCHFSTKLAGFKCGDTQGIMNGNTTDGIPLEGKDSVRIIPCK